jgi:hypothetical protein
MVAIVSFCRCALAATATAVIKVLMTVDKIDAVSHQSTINIAELRKMRGFAVRRPPGAPCG